MVNTGRPSPACKACRARRLKCDQTKPACNKCTRAKRVCPGYREPFEINFKDQTDLIIRKHERSNSISKEVAPRRYSKGHKRWVLLPSHLPSAAFVDGGAPRNGC